MAQITTDRARYQAKIEANKELALKELELQAQAQVNIDATSNPPPPNRDAKIPKLPAFVGEKDELYSNLLGFERYADNAKWEKNTSAIKLTALLSGKAMDIHKNVQ